MLKQYTKDDLEMIGEWWDYYAFPLLPDEVLPNLGYIAYVDAEPVCAAWLYIEEKRICSWLTWVIMNPKAQTKARTEGFKQLVEGIVDRAKEEGIKFMYTPTNNPSLVKRFEDNGFTVYDKDVVDLARVL